MVNARLVSLTWLCFAHSISCINIGGTYTYNPDTSPVNATDRQQEAENFSLQDWADVENSRNYSTSFSETISSPAPPPAKSSSLIAASSLSSTSHPSIQLPSSAPGVIQTYRRSRRKRTAPGLLATAHQYPIDTRDQVTLAPIQRASLQTLLDLLSNARDEGRNRFNNNDGESWRNRNGTYSYNYGMVSFNMKEVPGAFEGTDSLDWNHFSEVADLIYTKTNAGSSTKSYVGSITRDNNQTTVGYFSVGWSTRDFPGDQTPSQNFWKLTQNETTITEVAGGDKLKARDDSLVLKRQANGPWRFPIFHAGLNTGFRMIIYKGAARVALSLLESCVMQATTGLWYDNPNSVISGQTVGNEPFDAEALKEADKNSESVGPYYEQIQYMPQYLRRFNLQHGLEIVMEQTWAASIAELRAFASQLMIKAAVEVWRTHGLSTSFSHQVESLYGYIEDAQGNRIALWALGQAVQQVQGAAWAVVEQPGGEILAGQFVYTHDEL